MGVSASAEKTIHPQEAVVLGAAVFGGIMNGEVGKEGVAVEMVDSIYVWSNPGRVTGL